MANNFSCYGQAVAHAVGLELDDVARFVGHDGDNGRGFSLLELVAFAADAGFHLGNVFAPPPELDVWRLLAQGKTKSHIVSPDTCAILIVPTANGQHALTYRPWDAEKPLYDPRGYPEYPCWDEAREQYPHVTGWQPVINPNE